MTRTMEVWGSSHKWVIENATIITHAKEQYSSVMLSAKSLVSHTTFPVHKIFEMLSANMGIISIHT